MADAAEPGTDSIDEEHCDLEALAEDFIQRTRRGEVVSVSQYAEKHPRHADEIRELFPAIAAMERLKHPSSDGPISLGAPRPQRLGDFRIIHEIGRGGMGLVYEAEQESLGRHVAIKVLPRQLLSDSRQKVRFAREARLAARLHHTNIVPVFGTGEQDGFHYYVMQLIRGVGLDRVIAALAAPGQYRGEATPVSTDQQILAGIVQSLSVATTGMLEAAELEGCMPKALSSPAHQRWVAQVGLQIAQALHYAHEQGTLHRDIKPANILVDAAGIAWITDFGLASVLHAGDATHGDEVGGTPRYMAPEQFSGRVDARTDLYSLGLTLFELLALTPVYRSTDRAVLLKQITAGSPPRLSTLNREAHRDLETIIHKAIQADPDHRYACAKDMADDLHCFLANRPIAARHISSAERLWRWCRRNRLVASLATTTILLLLAVTIVTTVGYVRTSRALRREAAEHARAEAAVTLAGEALDRVFARLSPSRFAVTNAVGNDGSQPVLSPETMTLLEEMLPFYDRLAEQTGDDPNLQQRAAAATGRIGDIRQRMGRYDQAIPAYRRAIERYEALAQTRPQEPTIRLAMAEVYNEIGRTLQVMRRIPEAQQSHQQALALLEAAGTEASPAIRFERARTHYFLGMRVAMTPGGGLSHQGPTQRPGLSQPISDPDLARELQRQGEHLRQAIALLTSLRQQGPGNPDYRHLLASCYREFVAPPGQAHLNSGDKAIEILESLVKDYPQVAQYRLDLCDSYAAIEAIEPGPKRMATNIVERLHKALALSQQLTAQYPNLPEYLVSQARIQQRLAYLHLQTRQLNEAAISARGALALQVQLIKTYPDMETHQVNAVGAANFLADILLRSEDPREACRVLNAGIARAEPWLKHHPDQPQLHAVLRDASQALAFALRCCGDQQGALDAEDQAAFHRSQLHEPAGPSLQPTTPRF